MSACPVPRSSYDAIVLGHGSGGRLSHDLVARVFGPSFSYDESFAVEDQAIVRIPGAGEIALTTDSFVVDPLFFPGGDIGKLSVFGTVNDLAVGGATPLSIAAAFILEEGFDIATLRLIAESMRTACDQTGVRLVTGDTKVVERGRGHGVFITTTGVGVRRPGVRLSATLARPGDRVIVSGTLGDHGIAVLAAREGIELETSLVSDLAALTGLVDAMLVASTEIHSMRDPTRGGLSSALFEIANASKVGVVIHESKLPLKAEVRGACELLGFDPMYVANEGKLVAIVAPEAADAVLEAMRRHPLGKDAAIVGEVVGDHPGIVTSRSVIGGERIVALLAGEQLPRIC
jgi:hydrogenase expression/formation protein HypE